VERGSRHLLSRVIAEVCVQSGPTPLAIQMDLVGSKVIVGFSGSLRLSSGAGRSRRPIKQVRACTIPHSQQIAARQRRFAASEAATNWNTWRWSAGFGLVQARACVYFKNSSSPAPVGFGAKILSPCRHTQVINVNSIVAFGL
jgi:hypothetical protein